MTSAAIAAPPASALQPPSGQVSYNPWSFESELDLGLVAALGDAEESLLIDADWRGEWEYFSEDGHRFGLVLGLRAQRDSGRRGLGRRLGDCPAGQADCAEVNNRPARGHVSGLYSDGAEDFALDRAGLETAYLFWRSGYGEIRAGHGPGASALERSDAPGPFRLMRADGGLLDPSARAAARTSNAASGFAPKILFRSERFGQAATIGAFGASLSFTPEATGCGVDVCLAENGPGAPLTPQMENLVELAGSYEIARGGAVWSLSSGLARGAESTGLDGFDGLESYSVDLGWRRGAWSASLSHLRSNNGVADGDYSATAGLITYERGDWLTGFEAAGYSDDFVHADGLSLQVGASKLLGEAWVAGAGLQWNQEDAPIVTSAGREALRTDSLIGFLELGRRF